MFCVVSFSGEQDNTAVKRRFKRGKKPRKPPAQNEWARLSRVCVPGVPAFSMLTLDSPDRLNEQEIVRLFASFPGRMVMPDIDTPEELKRYVYKPYALSDSILLHDALSILKTAHHSGNRCSVCVADATLRTKTESVSLLRFASSLEVVTQNMARLESLNNRAMDEYGAYVRRTERADYSGRIGMIVDFDAGAIAVIDKKVLPDTVGRITPKYPPLPQELISAVPQGTDMTALAGALYEFCGFSADNT